MNIMIFDTETTSLDKPFCYNIGYVIVNSETEETLVKRDFVVEQVWHNPMLFTTAYYANKRELYISSMRSRKTSMDKYNIPIYDIRGYAHHYICGDDFKKWCEEYEAFSESGNYSTTAENVYRYISGNTEFVEEHTALADSEIETEILLFALDMGAEIETEYKAFRTIARPQRKIFTVKKNNEIVFIDECDTIRYMKTNNTIILKG